MLDLPTSFFRDESEQVRGILGREYLKTISGQVSSSGSTMVLSDRHLYHEGKRLERGNGGKLVRQKGTKAVAIKDVRQTYIQEVKSDLLVLVGTIMAIARLVTIWATLAIGYETDPAMDFYVSLLLLIPFLGYFIWRRRYFLVEHVEGAMAADCGWFRPRDIEDFRQRISNAKAQATQEPRPEP